MKRLAFALIALALLPAFAFGLSVPSRVSSIQWKDARSLGMGDASLLFSSGYDTFFGNPAGFAEKGSLTLTDISICSYPPIMEDEINHLSGMLDNSLSAADRDAYLNSWLTTNGRLGGGASIGLGWAGNGFGLGVNMVSDLALVGDSYENSRLYIANQMNAVAGFGVPIQLGFLKISLGADARGFYRIDSSRWSAYDIINAAFGYTDDFEAVIDDEILFGGFGYAFDAGITLRAGPLMAGFMARNLFAKLDVEVTTVGEIDDNDSLPTDQTYPVAYEPTYTAGLGLRFWEKGLFAPSFYAQTSDIEGFMTAIGDGSDVVATMQIGGELRILRLLLLRAGLDENFMTIGAGVDLALLRVDAAIFIDPFNNLVDGAQGMALRASLKL
ncbi:MAG TPA: hypothetical protein VN445_05050 [Rectinemataceae bacterium]|nr:hypothetical protein [Rectinemataceae bacterium]